jgi:hypothetical protein
VFTKFRRREIRGGEIWQVDKKDVPLQGFIHQYKNAMKFYDREKELNTLEETRKVAFSKVSQMTVLTGRRRPTCPVYADWRSSYIR